MGAYTPSEMSSESERIVSPNYFTYAPVYKLYKNKQELLRSKGSAGRVQGPGDHSGKCFRHVSGTGDFSRPRVVPRKYVPSLLTISEVGPSSGMSDVADGHCQGEGSRRQACLFKSDRSSSISPSYLEQFKKKKKRSMSSRSSSRSRTCSSCAPFTPSQSSSSRNSIIPWSVSTKPSTSSRDSGYSSSGSCTIPLPGNWNFLFLK